MDLRFGYLTFDSSGITATTPRYFNHLLGEGAHVIKDGREGGPIQNCEHKHWVLFASFLFFSFFLVTGLWCSQPWTKWMTATLYPNVKKGRMYLPLAMLSLNVRRVGYACKVSFALKRIYLYNISVFEFKIPSIVWTKSSRWNFYQDLMRELSSNVWQNTI